MTTGQYYEKSSRTFRCDRASIVQRGRYIRCGNLTCKETFPLAIQRERDQFSDVSATTDVSFKSLQTSSVYLRELQRSKLIEGNKIEAILMLTKQIFRTTKALFSRLQQAKEDENNKDDRSKKDDRRSKEEGEPEHDLFANLKATKQHKLADSESDSSSSSSSSSDSEQEEVHFLMANQPSDGETKSSVSLNKLYETQKPPNDRTGLGFNVEENISEGTSTQSDPVYGKFKKMNFVKGSVMHNAYESVRYDDQTSGQLNQKGKAGIRYIRPENSKPSWLKNGLDKEKVKAGSKSSAPHQPRWSSTKDKSVWRKVQPRRDMNGPHTKPKLNRSHHISAHTLMDFHTRKTVKMETDMEEPSVTRSDDIIVEIAKRSIAVNDEDDNLDGAENEIARKMASFTAPKQFLKEPLRSGEDDDMSGFNQPSKIIEPGTTETDKEIEPVGTEDLSLAKSAATMTDSEDIEPLSKALVPTDSTKSDEESMSIEDILKHIPADLMLPSMTAAEPTRIKFTLGIEILGVNEGDWYKASLPRTATSDKGKAPLIENEIKGHPDREMFSLICVDIDFLVQLREKEEERTRGKQRRVAKANYLDAGSAAGRRNTS
ncbi:splicing factor 3B subunit 1-like [Dorcoceras hygrometricum]|uniref:Splicing factor 3B subunit 1-like n=1 Tax=Dorcoceras hygrometricum TaxID=472368 RepID=A0A2Z7D6A3_9LAMI|nr:splicing factor 3B subunit 1-like [Dorcoceras hygrometricum]